MQRSKAQKISVKRRSAPDLQRQVRAILRVLERGETHGKKA